MLGLVDLEKELVNASDYVALPNHECAPATLADVISIGPGLSVSLFCRYLACCCLTIKQDTRARLSLFTEDFISLISYKEPKEYKPIKPLQVAQIDRDLVAQASSQLGERIQGLVMRCLQAYQNPTIKLELTGAELSFFTTVNFLVCFVVSVTKTPLTKSTTRPVRTADIAATIDVEVQNQVQKMQDERDNISDTKTALHQFASLHALGMLRESVQVVKLVVNYLERAALTTKTDVPKWLNEDIKSLNCTASDATATIKQRIKLLNDAANTSGWLDSISEFAFGDLAKGTKTVDTNPKDAESSDLDTMVFQASGQKAGLVNTIGEIKDSWQEVAKGWNTVKFD